MYVDGPFLYWNSPLAWTYYSPLVIVDKSESEVIGAQLYVDGPFLYWNSSLGLLSPLETVDKSESEVIGVQLYIDGPLDIY